MVESLVGYGALGRLGAPMEGQRGVLRGTTCIGVYLATHGPMDVVVLPNGGLMRCTEVDMATDSLAEVGVTIYCGLHGLQGGRPPASAWAPWGVCRATTTKCSDATNMVVQPLKSM